MARFDLKVIKNPGGVIEFDSEDWTTADASSPESITATMKPGEPVKVCASSGTNFVILLCNGDPYVNCERFVGIVNKESTETTSADGKCDVQTLIPGLTVIRGKTTTTTNLNTAAKLLGLKFDCVTLDRSSGTYTINEDLGTDADVNGLCIVGGDYEKYTLDVIPHVNVIYTGEE